VIKRPVGKRDRICALTKYYSLICNASTKVPVTDKMLNASDILALKNGGQLSTKKNNKSVNHPGTLIFSTYKEKALQCYIMPLI
jgi:hypothetical protein